MRCIHCGQVIEEDARHCMFCGTKQNAAPAVSAEQMSFAGNAAPAAAYAAPMDPQPAPESVEPGDTVAPPYEPVFVPPVAPETPVAEPFVMPVTPVAAPAAQTVVVEEGTKIIYVQGARPALQLATNRSLAKMIFLGLVTFGIYNMVIYSKMTTDLNVAASRYDGRRTMSYFGMCTLAPLTLFILPWVWIHNLCDRIKAELNRRNIDYKFGPATFWLWNVLGSLILVGPFIFIHKLMKSMNKLCENFNQNG